MESRLISMWNIIIRIRYVQNVAKCKQVGSLQAPKSLLDKFGKSLFFIMPDLTSPKTKILEIKIRCFHWCLPSSLFWPLHSSWLYSCTELHPAPVASSSFVESDSWCPFFLQNGAPLMWPFWPHVKQTTSLKRQVVLSWADLSRPLHRGQLPELQVLCYSKCRQNGSSGFRHSLVHKVKTGFVYIWIHRSKNSFWLSGLLHERLLVFKDLIFC